MYRYLWLITFEIFQFIFWDRGVGQWVNCIQTFFGFFIYFIFTRPLHNSLARVIPSCFRSPSLHFPRNVFPLHLPQGLFFVSPREMIYVCSHRKMSNIADFQLSLLRDLSRGPVAQATTEGIALSGSVAFLPSSHSHRASTPSMYTSFSSTHHSSFQCLHNSLYPLTEFPSYSTVFHIAYLPPPLVDVLPSLSLFLPLSLSLSLSL